MYNNSYTHHRRAAAHTLHLQLFILYLYILHLACETVRRCKTIIGMSRARRNWTKTETVQRSFSSPFTRPSSKQCWLYLSDFIHAGNLGEAPNIPKKSEGVIMAPGPQWATQNTQMFRMQGVDRAQTRWNSYKVILTNSFNIFPDPTSHQKSQPEAKLSKLGLFFLFSCLFSKHIDRSGRETGSGNPQTGYWPLKHHQISRVDYILHSEMAFYRKALSLTLIYQNNF